MTTAQIDVQIDPVLDEAPIDEEELLHRRCAKQIGLEVRQMLCGRIRVGRPVLKEIPRCPRCEALRVTHRRFCQTCQDTWGSL